MSDSIAVLASLVVVVVMSVLVICVGDECDNNDDGDEYGDDGHCACDGDVDDGNAFLVSLII